MFLLGEGAWNSHKKANSTQKVLLQPGIDLRTFLLWGDSTNHWSTVLTSYSFCIVVWNSVFRHVYTYWNKFSFTYSSVCRALGIRSASANSDLTATSSPCSQCTAAFRTKAHQRLTGSPTGKREKGKLWERKIKTKKGKSTKRTRT